MGREQLKRIAEDTVKISKAKYYIKNGKKINFNTKEKFKMYEEDNVDITDVRKNKNIPNIIIKNESTIKTIRENCNEKFGVLNFASAKHPGGGFLGGSMAQEECLAYSSDLYVQQWPNARLYYEKHREQNHPFYTNTMFVNNVTFFRDEKFDLIDNPIECVVLTSAAVNLTAAKQKNLTDTEGYVIMKERMRKILKVFVASGCKDIVLGAFGCGVFGNSAEKVATIWRELLIEEKMEYYFDNIYFSILDNSKSNNLNKFVDVFSKT